MGISVPIAMQSCIITKGYHTMKLSIQIEETNLIVSKRDGASVTVDLAKIPETLFSDFVQEGVSEYIRDASANALMVAYLAAHDGDEGNIEGRKEWAKDNGQKIATESEALMTDAVTRLYDGIRTRRVAGGTVDPLDAFRIAYMRRLMKAAPKGDLAKAYKAIPSDEQKARTDFLLAVAAKNASTIDPEAQALSDAYDAEMKLATDAVADIKVS